MPENFEGSQEDKEFDEEDIEKANKLRKQLPNLFLLIDTEFNFYDSERTADVSVKEEGEKLIKWIDNFCNNTFKDIGVDSGQTRSGFVGEVNAFAESLRQIIKENFVGSDSPNIDELFGAFRKLQKFEHDWQDEQNITRIDGTEEENESANILWKDIDWKNYDARKVDVTRVGVRWLFDSRIHELDCALRVDDKQWEELLKQMKERGQGLDSEDRLITEVVTFVVVTGYIIPRQEFASERTNPGEIPDPSKSFIKRARVVYLKKAPK